MRQTVRIPLILTALLVFELPIRIHSYLNPSTYIRSRRIVRRTDGLTKTNSKKFAIVVIWQAADMLWHFENLLDELMAQQINVLTVVNCTLKDEQRDKLLTRSWRILERDNTGRDMGAYQDGILELSGQKVSRMLLLNDSVYYLENGLRGFVSEMTTDDQVIVAAHENFERSPHLQSYALSLPRQVIEHKDFIRYWSTYLPVSSRRYCIHRGELGFSKMVQKIPTDIRIIYSIKKLRDVIAELSVQELFNCRRMFNRFLRPLYYYADGHFPPVGWSTKHENLIREWQLDVLSNIASIGSPIHGAGAMFNKHLNSPLVKRDIYYRCQFDLHEIEYLLDELGLPEDKIEEIVSDLRRRGTYKTLGLFDKIKYSAGII